MLFSSLKQLKESPFYRRALFFNSEEELRGKYQEFWGKTRGAREINILQVKGNEQEAGISYSYYGRAVRLCRGKEKHLLILKSLLISCLTLGILPLFSKELRANLKGKKVERIYLKEGLVALTSKATEKSFSQETGKVKTQAIESKGSSLPSPPEIRFPLTTLKKGDRFDEEFFLGKKTVQVDLEIKQNSIYALSILFSYNPTDKRYAVMIWVNSEKDLEGYCYFVIAGSKNSIDFGINLSKNASPPSERDLERLERCKIIGHGIFPLEGGLSANLLDGQVNYQLLFSEKLGIAPIDIILSPSN